MMIELNLTQIIFLAIAGFTGLWAMLKAFATLFTRSQQRVVDEIRSADAVQHKLLDARLDALQQILKDDSGQWHRMERELLNLKAELPLHYVRREDYIQNVATIMTKLDAMAIRFENIILKGQQREL